MIIKHFINNKISIFVIGKNYILYHSNISVIVSFIAINLYKLFFKKKSNQSKI